MHRCSKKCKSDIGFHYHSSSTGNAERQLKESVKHLEKRLIEVKEELGQAPTPENYEIQNVYEIGDRFKILLVKYPNCTNFDGMKCILTDCSMMDLIKLKRLDPHFTKTVPPNGIRIIARFPPDELGIANAGALARYLQENEK